MGLLRAARTVTSPDGDVWELYVTKTRLPTWQQGDSGDYELRDPIEIVAMVLNTVWSMLVLPLLRFVFLLPFAVVGGRRSRAVRIEAISWYPGKRVLLWTTTQGQVDGVVKEIAEGLAAGRVVEPVGSVYSGEQPG